jgi:hypothetical protein
LKKEVAITIWIYGKRGEGMGRNKTLKRLKTTVEVEKVRSNEEKEGRRKERRG